MPKKDKVLLARKAVDDYRNAHTLLHSVPWYEGVPAAHTPILNTMKGKLKEQSFNSSDEFFIASDELNVMDFGSINDAKAWK